MVKGIFEIIWEDPDKITDKRLRFESISDFFRLTDMEFLTLATTQPQLSPIVDRLMHRELLERSLVISKRYLNPSGNFMELYKKSSEDYPDKLWRLRNNIWQDIPTGRRGSIHDLWVDIPKPPTSIAKDPARAWIDIGTREMLRLRDFFPYPEWVTSYEANKWKGHVFSLSAPPTRWTVNEAAIRVLGDKPYHLEFDAHATKECKLPPKTTGSSS